MTASLRGQSAISRIFSESMLLSAPASSEQSLAVVSWSEVNGHTHTYRVSATMSVAFSVCLLLYLGPKTFAKPRPWTIPNYAQQPPQVVATCPSVHCIDLAITWLLWPFFSFLLAGFLKLAPHVPQQLASPSCVQPIALLLPSSSFHLHSSASSDIFLDMNVQYSF